MVVPYAFLYVDEMREHSNVVENRARLNFIFHKMRNWSGNIFKDITFPEQRPSTLNTQVTKSIAERMTETIFVFMSTSNLLLGMRILLFQNIFLYICKRLYSTYEIISYLKRLSKVSVEPKYIDDFMFFYVF